MSYANLAISDGISEVNDSKVLLTKTIFHETGSTTTQGSKTYFSRNELLPSTKSKKPVILLDSGATDHVFSDKRLFGWLSY